MESIKNGQFSPCIVYREDEPMEFAALPLTSFPPEYQVEHFDSISKVLETYYASKNVITRIRQKSSDLRRIVQTALERNYKKYDLQQKQLKDTKQPASRLQQILGILDSDVIVTSEKYLKDLEKLEFKGKVLMAPDLAAEQENEAVLNEIREQALDVDPLYGIITSLSSVLE